MHALLLSAGQGRRLLPLTTNRPKCALRFHGRSVLEWQIDTLLAAGVDRVTVVLGYGAAGIESLLGERYPGAPVHPLFNPFFRVSDNLASCWVARSAMAEDFLLINGDTVFEGSIIRGLLAHAHGPITLTVDHKTTYDDDDMKVVLGDNGQLQQVGKQLPAERVNGESIGISCFRGQGPGLFRDAVEAAMREPEALQRWYLSVIDELAGQTLVHWHSIAGQRWAELDFREDLEDVASVLAPTAATTAQATSAG